jgi:Meckel syndrome type 1 protein
MQDEQRDPTDDDRDRMEHYLRWREETGRAAPRRWQSGAIIVAHGAAMLAVVGLAAWLALGHRAVREASSLQPATPAAIAASAATTPETSPLSEAATVPAVEERPAAPAVSEPPAVSRSTELPAPPRARARPTASRRHTRPTAAGPASTKTLEVAALEPNRDEVLASTNNPSAAPVVVAVPADSSAAPVVVAVPRDSVPGEQARNDAFVPRSSSSSPIPPSASPAPPAPVGPDGTVRATPPTEPATPPSGQVAPSVEPAPGKAATAPSRRCGDATADDGTRSQGRRGVDCVGGWVQGQAQEARDGVRREIDDFRDGVDRVGRALQWLGRKLRRPE